MCVSAHFERPCPIFLCISLYCPDGQTNALDPSKHPDFVPKEAGPYPPSPYESAIAHCVPKFPPLPPTKEERRKAFLDLKAALAADKSNAQRKAAEDGWKNLGDAMADFDAPSTEESPSASSVSSKNVDSASQAQTTSSARTKTTVTTTTTTTTTTTSNASNEPSDSTSSASSTDSSQSSTASDSSSKPADPTSQKSEFVSNLLNDYQKSQAETSPNSASKESASKEPNSGVENDGKDGVFNKVSGWFSRKKE